MDHLGQHPKVNVLRARFSHPVCWGWAALSVRGGYYLLTRLARKADNARQRPDQARKPAELQPSPLGRSMHFA